MNDNDFSHPCSWPGCKQLVPPYWWGCKPHWFALPVKMRRAIWRTYRPREDEEPISCDRFDAMDAAQTWIWWRYHRLNPTAPAAKLNLERKTP